MSLNIFNLKEKLRSIILLKIPDLYWKIKARSQSNNLENKYIFKYSKQFSIDKSFIEFGFSLIEFNCVQIAKKGFKGLLIDANSNTCDLANNIFRRLGLKVNALNYWLKVDSLEPILEFIKNNKNKLGVLSIDIDGVDYWILKEIYKHIKPEIIVVEYNASFGLKPISVPYDENFERMTYHKSGWYHGASFTAFQKLLEDEYILKENIDGLNLIFIRKDKFQNIKTNNFPIVTYKEQKVRNIISKLNASRQWEFIKNLEFEEV